MRTSSTSDSWLDKPSKTPRRFDGSHSLIAAPVVLLHVAGLAALLAARAPASAVPPAAAISTYAVADLPAASTAPEIEFRLEQITADADIPSIPEEALTTSGDAAPADGKDCDLTDEVQASLRGSPAVRAALDDLPRDARSVANAVMLWDGHWIEGASPAARNALAKIRAVVTATVAAAPMSCRAAAQAGPRLVALAGSPDTVLALGSGRWRWDDLASP